MGARQKMTMRCTIQRNAGATDDWGGTTPDWQTHLADVPCYAYIQGRAAGREQVTEDRAVFLEDRRVLMPLDTDVTVAHRILQITDRQGQVLYDGPMTIDAVTRRRDHLQLAVEDID